MICRVGHDTHAFPHTVCTNICVVGRETAVGRYSYKRCIYAVLVNPSNTLPPKKTLDSVLAWNQTHPSVHQHTHISTHAHIHVHTHTHIHMRTTYTHTLVRTHTYTHECTCIKTNTNTYFNSTTVGAHIHQKSYA